MKRRLSSSKYRCDEKLKIYSGAPVNRGFYQRNLKQAKTLYMGDYLSTPSKYFERKNEDKAFNQILDNYYKDYNKISKKYKFGQDDDADVEIIDNNLYQFKKKKIRNIFDLYVPKIDDETFELTDELISNMSETRNKTLINSTQINNDYNMRLAGIKQNYNYDDEDDYDENESRHGKNKNKHRHKGRDRDRDRDRDWDNDNYSDKKKKDRYQDEDDNDEDNYKKRDREIDDDERNTFREESNVSGDQSSSFEKYNKNNSSIAKDNRKKGKFNDSDKIIEEELDDMIKNNDFPMFVNIIKPSFKQKYKPPPVFPRDQDDEDEDEEPFDIKLIYKDDNYFDFPPFEKIILPNFEEFGKRYQPPLYEKPESIIKEEMREERAKNKQREEIENMYNDQRNTRLNKYDDGDLKQLDNIITDYKYPLFTQIINPYFQTDYKPPEVFKKEPGEKDEEEDEDLGYDDFEMDKVEGDDNYDNQALKLLSNMIENEEYPMFDKVTRNDYKGSYMPPLYKVPPKVAKEEEKEALEKQRQQEEYEKNKTQNHNINVYNNGELKLFSDIITDYNYPMFEQVINPFHQTLYTPPPTFPKPKDLDEEQNLYVGYEDFPLIQSQNKIKGNNDEQRLVLLNNEILNKEYPMFDRIILSSFADDYAPPFYKKPKFIEEEEEIKYIKEMKNDIYPVLSSEINSCVLDDFPLFEKIISCKFEGKYVPPILEGMDDEEERECLYGDIAGFDLENQYDIKKDKEKGYDVKSEKKKDDEEIDEEYNDFEK